MKQCFHCLKWLSRQSFYRHPGMSDGRLGKCKECIKEERRAHYMKNRDRIRAYDKKRERDPRRRERKLEYQRRYRERNGYKVIARQRVARALKSGRLSKKPCGICGDTKVEAHHDDYQDPLQVTWLCFRHHRERHGQML